MKNHRPSEEGPSKERPSKARPSGERLFLENLPVIETVIRRVAARHQLDHHWAQDLYGVAMLKMIQNDYAVLRIDVPESKWEAYLTVVVQRVLSDLRIREWGRWRPCAQARRLGPLGVWLDQRINRDAVDPETAVRELHAVGVAEGAGPRSPRELERIADRVPRRPRRRPVSLESCAVWLRAPESTHHRGELEERQNTMERLRKALGDALDDLPARERRFVRLRFEQSWTVRRIAAEHQLEERRLYSLFSKTLKGLRRRLETLGLGWMDVGPLLEGHDVDPSLDLR